MRNAGIAFFAINTDLDLLVTDDPVHIGYLSGYRSILQDSGAYPQALVVTRENIALITGASDGAAALEVLNDPRSIWRYGTFFVFSSGDMPSYEGMPAATKSPAEAVSAAIATMTRNAKNVGCDLHRPELRAAVESVVPQDRLLPATEAFRRARAVKLPGELDLLRYVSRLTDNAIEGVADLIRPGVNELEVAAEITRVIAAGGGICRFVVVTSGERSSRVDAYARSRIMQDGDLVRLDIGATVNGYYSDMARTYAVGDPGPLARDRYSALLSGEQIELGLVRPGITAGAIFEAAMEEVRSGALPNYQRNHCGHGIGLRSHEFPLIGPSNETVLEPGMVLCVETPYYEIGWGGMMVEDTVIVTDTGCELLTESSRELCRPH
ncbi:Xaa-Pro peptidase family protein [Bradyrhizobium sp. 191]|uniref:M24 family metallopeptidase n=1 Tax=Bradyrhizobium sp. 191 TaxID=2782659 RepID=UPI001FFF1795|nr:Xaa-Pro peptidase family protein [Bradyrhizobium sp. 191]UPJ63687.1 aminopeptidase P family protein [Bradyrhizobium sp. 191]